MSNVCRITVAHGDGIGPEIMAASLHIIQSAGARIETEVIEIGEKVYVRGNSAAGYTLAQGQ
jgi:isocitrate dehydrogenase